MPRVSPFKMVPLLFFLIYVPIVLTLPNYLSADESQIVGEVYTTTDMTLTAQPNETVSQTYNVPVEVKLSDGTSYWENRQVEFSVTNTVESDGTGSHADSNIVADATSIKGTDSLLSTAANPTQQRAISNCSGNLNQDSKYYTGSVRWTWTGTTAQYLSHSHPRHEVIPPSQWTTTATGYSFNGAPVPSLVGYTFGRFYRALSAAGVEHRITFTLGASGSCSASGQFIPYN